MPIDSQLLSTVREFCNLSEHENLSDEQLIEKFTQTAFQARDELLKQLKNLYDLQCQKKSPQQKQKHKKCVKKSGGDDEEANPDADEDDDRQVETEEDEKRSQQQDDDEIKNNASKEQAILLEKLDDISVLFHIFREANALTSAES